MKSGLYLDLMGDLEYVVEDRHTWWWDGFGGMVPTDTSFDGPGRCGKTLKLPIEYLL